VTSLQNTSASSRSLVFDSNNVPELIYTNWPARSNEKIFNAISGDYNLVIKGVNVGKKTPTQDQQPRTAFGISQDKRYLFLLVIDGRQAPYSSGAYDHETAAWLILMGAYDGMNVDGGGSTTMVIEDSTGKAKRLNRPSAVADSGKERTIASHFGIYAKPAPGFINDVVANPDDKTATITWSTLLPATTQVEYGTTIELGTFSPLDTSLGTAHSVNLTDLIPSSDYYFRAISTAEGNEHTSQINAFHTTNYVSTNLVFEVTNPWKYNWVNLGDTAWFAKDYDDSEWQGPASGLLWVDTRAGGPIGGVEPRNTQMPYDPATVFPYGTYYLRTHFTLTDVVPGMSLLMSTYIDDGAVFYLNGSEMLRLRMPESAPIGYSTLATGYPCAGDATADCPEEIEFPREAMAHLLPGDNVLAVEVHNYSARSPDITFGLSLAALIPVPHSAPASLSISTEGGALTLIWEAAGFALQQAASVDGPWQNAPGAFTVSPYHAEPAGTSVFYRLFQE
jgi:hypothetical protein